MAVSEKSDSKKDISCGIAQFSGAIIGMLVYFSLYMYVVTTFKGNDALNIFSSAVIFVLMAGQIIYGIGNDSTKMKPVSWEEHFVAFIKGFGGFTLAAVITIVTAFFSGRKSQI